jgi:hypothetical protein
MILQPMSGDGVPSGPQPGSTGAPTLTPGPDINWANKLAMDMGFTRAVRSADVFAAAQAGLKFFLVSNLPMHTGAARQANCGQGAQRASCCNYCPRPMLPVCFSRNSLRNQWRQEVTLQTERLAVPLGQASEHAQMHRCQTSLPWRCCFAWANGA